MINFDKKGLGKKILMAYNGSIGKVLILIGDNG